MKPQEILITNVLPTRTGFAVLAENMTESVFVPSKLVHDTPVNPGDRVSALLVPNPTRPDKTKWLAVSFAGQPSRPVPAAPQDTLADLILDDLKNGRGTVEEIAENLNMSDQAIGSKLAELVNARRVVTLQCFDLPEVEA
jgi:hypothetical protein